MKFSLISWRKSSIFILFSLSLSFDFGGFINISTIHVHIKLNCKISSFFCSLDFLFLSSLCKLDSIYNCKYKLSPSISFLIKYFKHTISNFSSELANLFAALKPSFFSSNSYSASILFIFCFNLLEPQKFWAFW